MLVIVDGPSFLLPPSELGVFERHSWTIRNDGPYPLTLRTHFTSGRSGFSLWLGREQTIPPGGSVQVDLTWQTPSLASTSFSRHAEVWTNDPEQAKVRFKVVGKTGSGR